jgi:small ubiquitin-related modifier
MAAPQKKEYSPKSDNDKSKKKMADPQSPADQSIGADAPEAQPEHLNIKVTDNNNEVFFKIKRNTKLEKLMMAFCERQAKSLNSVRFLFDGQRVQPTDTPETVSNRSPAFIGRTAC